MNPVHEPVHEPVAVFLRPARCTAQAQPVYFCAFRSARSRPLLSPHLNVIVRSCNTIDLLFCWDPLSHGLVSGYLYHPWTSIQLLRC